MQTKIAMSAQRASGRRVISVAVLCLATAALVAAPAYAAVKTFTGAMKATEGSVSFDALKRDGRYRSVSNFTAAAVPIRCDRSGNLEVDVVASDTFTVAADGTFRGISDYGDVIKGKFGDQGAKGTIKVSFTAYYPSDPPENCYTDAPEPWTAARAG